LPVRVDAVVMHCGQFIFLSFTVLVIVFCLLKWLRLLPFLRIEKGRVENFLDQQ
jgi:hypothetical protein